MQPQVIPCRDEKEWLASRALSFVGASEAAALFELNPYMTRLALWERLQGVEHKVEVSDAMLAGIELEDGIARLYARKTGERVLLPSEFYGKPKLLESDEPPRIIVRHDTAPIQCTPDRIIVTKHGARLLQIKNVSAWKADEWMDTPPVAYQIQCQAEMACTGFGEATLCALIGGNELVIHELKRNEAFIHRLILRATELVGFPIAPPPGSDEEVKRLFPQSVDGLSKELEQPELLYEFARLKAELDELEKALEPVKAALQADIGPAETFTVNGKKGGSWKTSVRNEAAREARSYPVRTLRLDASITKEAKALTSPRHASPLLSE